MRTFIGVLVLAGCALAGRLENTYLPPPGAALAGGAGLRLATPLRTNSDSSVSSETRSSGNQRPALIIKQVNENPGDGTYSFSYETENGIQAEEAGQLRQDGAEGTASVQGAYSFTAPDNVRYSVSYTADENGFQAYGAHLPTPPPVPEAIQRALELNAANEARGILDDGQYHPEQHGDGAILAGLRSGSQYQQQQQQQQDGYHY